MALVKKSNVPAILLVDSSGFDGSSVPDHVSKTVALRMLQNRHKKKLSVGKPTSIKRTNVVTVA